MTATPAATLLDAATFITAVADRGVAPLFRTREALDQPAAAVASARLAATAHGVYEATVNGVPATESVLNPGWTSYEGNFA